MFPLLFGNGFAALGSNGGEVGELFGRYGLAAFRANRGEVIPHFSIRFRGCHGSISSITSIVAARSIRASVL